MHANAAHLDFETKSTTDLRKSGVHRYCEDPNTMPWCFSYSFGADQPKKRWKPGDPDPIDLLEHIAKSGVIVAHNASFERTVWRMLVRKLCPHWPLIKISQQDCTMARAAAIAHPQDLDTLAIVIGAAETKDREGSTLMMKMCRPRRFNADGTITWWDDPADIERLQQYCDQDVRTEEEVDARIPPLTDEERRVWQFDQVINDRGIYVDLLAVQKCSELVEFAKKQADVEMRKLTDRAVPKCSNDASIIRFINSHGIECTTVKKGVQDDLMFLGDLHDKPIVREVIELRRASKKTSTAKYAAMLKCVCADQRIRGLLNYHGAAPGRWAGRLVQPQNFPRVDYDEEGHIINWLHELLVELPVQEVYNLIAAVHGPISPLLILSRALRSMIKAPEGMKLVGGDFSNIEGRINAWLAGEQWKLDAFSKYDTIIGEDKKGKPLRAGPDLYNLAYAKSFGISVEAVTKANRQIGKVQELALGYQGGVGAFINMGDNYGLNPYDLSKPIYDATPSYQWDETAMKYHKKGANKHGLQEREWTALQVIVDNWRKANSGIVQSWWDYQDAAIEAASAPGTIVSVAMGRVKYYSDGRALWCVLPCGRMLCYASPEVVAEQVEYTDKNGDTKTRTKHKVNFWGVDSETRQWKKQSLYGGLQCENIVQGTARDVMVDRMFDVERKGYPIILTVHDEIVAEVAGDRVDLNDIGLQEIMSQLPPWAEGLPLAAAAWQDERYVK